MTSTNKKVAQIFTHEGAVAQHLNAKIQLRRSVMCCMLWESGFYETGEEITDRIKNLIPFVEPEKVAEIAIECREKMKLRHVPLLIVREMARLKTHKHLVAKTLERIIQRADELSEFLSIYWKEKRQPISAGVKRGLASAFKKFNEYQLSKYNRDTKIKLRDVLFLCHAKPINDEQASLWKRLVNDELAVPDTWEVALSSSKNKKETWERLLSESKLGGLAFLRNLRNMKEAGVNETLISKSLENLQTDRILPFRFISAATMAPQWEHWLEPVMFRCLKDKKKLSGKTVLVIDGSGSMFYENISSKSKMSRIDAAAALAILLREICENIIIIVFSENASIVPSRYGFALRDVIYTTAEKRGTNTQYAIDLANSESYDRIIVITDEQSHQQIRDPLPATQSYFINVACNKNGIGYGKWVHIDGWSEAVIDFITEYEASKI